MSKPKFTKAQLDKLINKMLSLSEKPSPIVYDIRRYEGLHERVMLENFYPYIEKFEHGFDLLVRVVDVVNYVPKDTWPEHRSIQFLLLRQSLYSLYSAFDRLIKGFHYDSMILSRTTYEALIKILYITYYPLDPHAVLRHKAKKGERKFNLTIFLKEDLNVDWEFIYRLTSSLAHICVPVLMEAIELHKEGQKGPIYFELKFNKDISSSSMNFSAFLIWALFKLSLTLFIDLKEKNVRPIKSNIIATEKGFRAVIMTMPNKFPDMCQDMIKILKEVKKKEKSHTII